MYAHGLRVLCSTWYHRHVVQHAIYMFLYVEHNMCVLHTVFLHIGIYIYFYSLQMPS